MSELNKTHSSDRVEVHTPEILNEIIMDNAYNDSIYVRHKDSFQRHRSRSMSAPLSKSRNPTETRCGRLTAPIAERDQFRGCRIQTWLNEDSVKEVQEKSDSESRSIRNICTAVLDNEDSLVQDVDQFLEYTDVSNENKRHMLFKKWSERVYTPLKEKIDMEMNSSNFKDYQRKKRDLYQKYLEYRNRKDMVFLDVYSPEEYDPLQLIIPRPGPLKAKVHSLDQNDPLLFQGFKRIAEDQDILRCRTGRTKTPSEVREYHLPSQPLVPLGREKTSCKTWLRMPIHDIDSPPRLKSRQKMSCVTNQSQIGFDKWKNTVSSPQLVDLELHCQKKRHYPEKYIGRQILEWPEVPRTYQTHCRTLSETATF